MDDMDATCAESSEALLKRWHAARLKVDDGVDAVDGPDAHTSSASGVGAPNPGASSIRTRSRRASTSTTAQIWTPAERLFVLGEPAEGGGVQFPSLAEIGRRMGVSAQAVDKHMKRAGLRRRLPEKSPPVGAATEPPGPRSSSSGTDHDDLERLVENYIVGGLGGLKASEATPGDLERALKIRAAVREERARSRSREIADGAPSLEWLAARHAELRARRQGPEDWRRTTDDENVCGVVAEDTPEERAELDELRAECARLRLQLGRDAVVENVVSLGDVATGSSR